MDRKFFLNTDMKTFRAWLGNHLEEKQFPIAEDIPMDDSYYLVYRNQLDYARDAIQMLLEYVIPATPEKTATRQEVGVIFHFALMAVNPSRVEVVATLNHEELAALSGIDQYFENILDEICQAYPEANGIDCEGRPPRKGGRKPPPREEMESIVNGWKKVEGKITQERYCNQKGISVSTLGHYIRKLEADHKT
jgi:hypothetical protein